MILVNPGEIGELVHHDIRLKILPFNAIETIRSLKLNITPRSRKKRKRIPFKQNGIVMRNLATVKRINHHDPNMVLAT